MKRRHFIRDSTLASISALLLTRCKYEQKYGQKDFGVQLWTVRDDMKKDPIGTLKIIKEIGYTDVECAGYHEGKIYNYAPNEFKKIISDIGLKMRSAHVPFGRNTPEQKRTMVNNWEGVCEDFKEIGVDYLVCPWMQDDRNIDTYKSAAEIFNNCGANAKSYGLQFAYHNHDFEFNKIDDHVPYDILLSETDKNLVDFELDLYWIKKGGGDTLDYFENHGDRFSLWHVKDMDNTQESFFTEVGNGIINWDEIFSRKGETALKHFYVEQDDCRNFSPLESINFSHDYLKNLFFDKKYFNQKG